MVAAYATQQVARFGVATADIVRMHVGNLNGTDCLTEVAINVRVSRIHPSTLPYLRLSAIKELCRHAATSSQHTLPSIHITVTELVSAR